MSCILIAKQERKAGVLAQKVDASKRKERYEKVLGMKTISTRQVHLDFHTSEHILKIGEEFDPVKFAETVKNAHINSMTVFARCHHGLMYYQSEKFPEFVHPHLSRPNLVIDQVKALHDVGIKAPIYITVQWDYFLAKRRPEWLIRKPGGNHEGQSFLEPGFYQSLCVNTEYYDFLVEHTTEICKLLGEHLDGIFFDITGIRPCYCSTCHKEMTERGINMWDAEEVRRFAKFVIDRFKKNMTEVVHAIRKECTIFYNAGHIGPCTADSKDAYSHFELESLASGQWGYLHFPISARYARTLGKPCMGMTGKFHKQWGDFHSLKNLAALEFECFRMLSYGMPCSIGDQLEPHGVLNPAAYRLIGNVFEPFERYEKWAIPSIPVVEAALITSEHALYEHDVPESVMGAAQMLEEIGLQFDIIGMDGNLSNYKLVILTDDLIVCSEFQEKLDAYVSDGGKVLSCGKGGLSNDMVYPNCFVADYQGEEQVYPSFVIPTDQMAKGLEEGNEYVMYLPGESITPKGTGRVSLEARTPYFKREKDYFCSHSYTPSAKGKTFPAAIAGEHTLLFAHPLFSIYRESAPLWCKKLIKNGIDSLSINRIVRHNGPSYLSVQVLEQPDQKRYCIHILSYAPIRKSATIDIVEERTVLTDLNFEFSLPHHISNVYSVMDEQDLSIENGKVVLPRIDGYAILELSYEDND